MAEADQTLNALLQQKASWVLNIGGTFDPPHRLHLQMAAVGFQALLTRLINSVQTIDAMQQCCQRLLVVLMPTQHNQLKAAPEVDGLARLAMLQGMLQEEQLQTRLHQQFVESVAQAFPSDPLLVHLPELAKQFVIVHCASLEINAPVATHTVDTLRWYRQFDSLAYLAVMLGVDSALSFPRWRAANACLRLIDGLLVVPRHDTPDHQQIGAVEQLLLQMRETECATQDEPFDFALFRQRLQFLSNFVSSEISSRLIRQRLAEHDVSAVKAALSPGVLEMIQSKGWYSL